MNFNLSAYFHDDILSRRSPDVKLDRYWILNSAMRYQFSRLVELQFDIRNLFDEQYSSWSPQAGIENGLPQRGRLYFLGVKLSLEEMDF